MARLKVTEGVLATIPTVFDGKNKVDTEAMKVLLRRAADTGSHGVMVNGTGGEWPRLTIEERKLIAEVTMKEVGDRVNVLIHTGCTRIEDTIDLSKHAKSIGAGAVTVISPVIDRIQQEEAYEYFRTVAEAVNVRMIIYDNAANSGVSLQPDTVKRISELDTVIGCKDEGGDIRKTSDIIERVGKKMDIMAGTGSMFLVTLVLGGTGGILGPPLIAPKLCLELYNAFIKGDLKKAREAHYQLMPLVAALSAEGKFLMAWKAALEMVGLPGGRMRPPLGPISDGLKKRIREVLISMGLIQS